MGCQKFSLKRWIRFKKPFKGIWFVLDHSECLSVIYKMNNNFWAVSSAAA